MRATLGRIAVVGFMMLGVCGCTTSSPSWSSMAWWRKKPDASATAGTDAPKFNAAAAALPSANQNPNNSLAGIANPAATNPVAASAAGANPAGAGGLSGYGAMPAGYQSSAYPTTPYPQAKLGAAPATTAGATAATSPWNATATNPSPSVGYSATSAMPGRYAPGAATTATPSYGATAGAAMPPTSAVNPTTMAGAPAYGAAAATSVGQPQAGLYNPTYDGGTANRYVSGAAIPATQSAMPAATAGSMPDYRTADARSGMSAATQTTTAAGPAASAMPSAVATGAVAAPSDDRYTGMTNAMTSAAGAPAAGYNASAAPPATANPFPPTADRYSQPTGGYDPSSAGIQPTTSSPPVGTSGYNPPDVYSPTAGVGAAAMSNRSATEYRPGGTSNYVSPTGGAVQPSAGSNASPDNHSQPGIVSPANYQSAVGGASPATVVLASASSPVPTGNEAYGTYQGSSAGSSASQPVYSSPNPPAATPALLPAHSAW